MARLIEPTESQHAAWEAWVAERPEPIRRVALRFDPWSLYRMKSTGNRVTLISFDRDTDDQVTLRVEVSGNSNRLLFARQVFGVSPDDLEPCDVPGNDEDVAA